MADAPDVSIAGVAFVGPVTAPGPGRDPCGGLAQRVEEVGGDGVVNEEIALCGEVFELLVGEHGSRLPGACQKNVDESNRELKLDTFKKKGVDGRSIGLFPVISACLHRVFCPYWSAVYDTR